VTIDYNEIRELIKTLAATDISEFSLKSADLELNIRKGTVNTALGPLAAPLPLVTAPVVANGEPVEFGQTLMWVNPE